MTSGRLSVGSARGWRGDGWCGYNVINIGSLKPQALYGEPPVWSKQMLILPPFDICSTNHPVNSETTRSWPVSMTRCQGVLILYPRLPYNPMTRPRENRINLTTSYNMSSGVWRSSTYRINGHLVRSESPKLCQTGIYVLACRTSMAMAFSRVINLLRPISLETPSKACKGPLEREM